ncbi:MAG: hypothetical protein KDE59_32850, partial [Anaerolineales bacterium]|nr:hypothetical protein [Anaerolineales bacterium]
MSKQQPNQSRQKPDSKSVQASRQVESGAPQAEQVQLGAIQAAMADPTQASRKAVRGAQRAYGNQHVQRTIQRRQVARRMQVNEPDDQYEKEAESVADSLQRSPAAATAPGSNGSGPADPAGSAPTAGAVQRAMTVSS